MSGCLEVSHVLSAFRVSEIGDFKLEVAGQEDVLRLKVSMNNSVRVHKVKPSD